MEKSLFTQMTPDDRAVTLSGNFTLDGSGVITASTPAGLSGCVVTAVAGKTARYLVTPYKNLKTYKAAVATVQGPDDVASGGTTTGESGAPMTRATSGASFIIQLRRASDLADANPTNGTKVAWIAQFSEAS